MSSEQELAKLVYICGDQSGVGKTTFCLTLLTHLVSIYGGENVAYIKPCTQCQDVQPLWKWCHMNKVECVGVGPIVYRVGYTHQVIDGQHGTREERLESVAEAVKKLQVGRKIVVIDGVGYSSVGACVGVSNADVAAYLKAPVLVVGKPGVGNAIDSTVLCTEFMAYRGANVVGVVFNKLSRSKGSRHSYEDSVKYVTKFFSTYTYKNLQTNENQPVHVYGFVPTLNEGNDGGSCSTSCSTNAACTIEYKNNLDLTMTKEEIFTIKQTCKIMSKYIDFEKMLQDILQEQNK